MTSSYGIMAQLAPGEFKHSWGTAEKLYKSEVRWDSDSYGKVDHSDQRAEVSWEAAFEISAAPGPPEYERKRGSFVVPPRSENCIVFWQGKCRCGLFFLGSYQQSTQSVVDEALPSRNQAMESQPPPNR